MDTVRGEHTPEETPPYVEHQGAHSQYVRDIILGVNDGLVSTFLLVVGVVSGGLSTSAVLLAGVAAAIAGAVSMAAGEYIATKSQEEVFEGEMALEREHLTHHRERELDELREWFTEMHLEADDVAKIVASLDQDDDAMMKVMMALEFGVVDSQRRNPYTAMVMSGVLFVLGALPSVLPFAFVDDPNAGLVIAAILSGIALFAVGAVKTLATRGNPVRSGLENLTIAVGGGIVAFAIGSLFDVVN
jgi:VIT1/CCC1 family predicted Fe2+/Mn2+ transporter